MLGGDVPMITPKDMNLPSVIYEMACQAATACSPGNYNYNLFICDVGSPTLQIIFNKHENKGNFYVCLCKNRCCKKLFPFDRAYQPSIRSMLMILIFLQICY